MARQPGTTFSDIYTHFASIISAWSIVLWVGRLRQRRVCLAARTRWLPYRLACTCQHSQSARRNLLPGQWSAIVVPVAPGILGHTRADRFRSSEYSCRGWSVAVEAMGWL